MEQLNSTAMLLAATLTLTALSLGRDASLKMYRDADGLCAIETEAPRAMRIELRIRGNYLVWVSCSAPGQL
ncbi:hypothetical protein F6455_09595 [Proteobacteria bacterium 005FR1]|nr:hypothetical protein [Proteobacteria bacterium 005FR1]